MRASGTAGRGAPAARSTSQATTRVDEQDRPEHEQAVQWQWHTGYVVSPSGERFPAREALVHAVPVGDLVSADLPAEEHLLAFAERREVDEAASRGPSPARRAASSSLDRLRDRARLGLALELLVQLAGLLRVEVAAVPRRCAAVEPRAALRPRPHALAVRPRATRRAGAPLEQRVRLRGSEVALAPCGYHRAPCPPVNAFACRSGRPAASCGCRCAPGTPRRRSSSGRACDLGRSALLASSSSVPEPPPARATVGRPVADARPRRGHRRLGPLGQRLVPAHRRARLRLGQARPAAFYPLYPAAVALLGRRALRPLRARRDRRLAGCLASARSCSRTGSPRSGSAPMARGGRCCYLAVFPFALFLQARLQRVALLAADAGRVHAAERRQLPRRGVRHGALRC